MLVASLRATVRDDPEFVTVLLELFALARRHPEIAAEVHELLEGMRSEVAAVLERSRTRAICSLRGDAHDIAALLFAVGDGAAMRALAEPHRDPAACCRRAERLRPLRRPLRRRRSLQDDR